MTVGHDARRPTNSAALQSHRSALPDDIQLARTRTATSSPKEQIMFTFPLPAVRAVIARGQSDAAANGGFRNPYYGLAPGKDERPGLWLVGDHGVYLMSNRRQPEGARPIVCYADQCNPETNPDWHDYKRRHFGTDDGTEFIAAEEILVLADRRPAATHLRLDLDAKCVGISIVVIH